MKKLLLFFVLLLVTTNLHSQNQVISRLKQPPPNRFGISDLWSIDLNNTTRKEIKGYIIGTLSEEKDGLIIEARTKLFTIKPGNNTYTQKDFPNADVSYYNNRYKEILLRTGGAPDGDYKICITVYNEADEVIGLENCIYHSVRQLGNIALLSPADGDEIDLEQPIIFSWTPLPDAKEYSLKIVELIGNQSPVTALEQNPPFFTKANIKASQFQYPLNERKFQSEKSYAWVISSNGVLSDIGLFTVKPSVIVSSDKLPTKYRITLMYPDGGIDISEVGQLQNDLEQTVKSMKIDSGMPNRISMNVSIPKQTQQPSFGERSSSEIKQLGESLFNLDNSVNEFPFGDDVIVLVGKQSGGKCPPADCGCDKSNLGCNCAFHNNFCFCPICVRETKLPPIEEEDVTLQLRVYNQPTITDSFKVVDVIMILADSTAEEVVKLKKIISEGLGIVDGLRESKKIQSLVIKQSYKSESLNDKKYRFTLMYPDGGISESRIENFESELKELAKILNGDSDVKSKGISTPKQTQGATFGERVNSNLINFLSEESTAELGEEILILIGGNPVGELQNCPPPGCGCTNMGGINCSCRNWGSFCLCLLCPIINTMDIMEELLPPPNDDNGKKTKDILIILENDLTKIDESLNDIVKLGLNKIAELRKNKIDAFTVKQKYKI